MTSGTFTYNHKSYDEKYSLLYSDLVNLNDKNLVDWWKYFQHHTRKKNDLFCIGYTVCEDILRQRANTYLDEQYRRD